MHEKLKRILELYSGKSEEQLKEYYDLVDSLRVKVPEPPTQVHHIVPRCVYRSEVDYDSILDSDQNLIRVSILDHIALHERLFLCTMDRKLFFAFNDTLLYNKSLFEDPQKLEVYSDYRKKLFVENMTNPESMRKKAESKRLKWGGSLVPPDWNSKEMVDKRRSTRIIRYGSSMGHRHTEEVRKRIADSHNGDADWQLHTPEAVSKMRRTLSTPVSKVDPETGRILKVYWGIKECARQEGFPEGTFKAKVRYEIPYKGFLWKKISKEEYENFLNSTT